MEVCVCVFVYTIGLTKVNRGTHWYIKHKYKKFKSHKVQTLHFYGDNTTRVQFLPGRYDVRSSQWTVKTPPSQNTKKSIYDFLTPRNEICRNDIHVFRLRPFRFEPRLGISQRSINIRTVSQNFISEGAARPSVQSQADLGHTASVHRAEGFCEDWTVAFLLFKSLRVSISTDSDSALALVIKKVKTRPGRGVRALRLRYNKRTVCDFLKRWGEASDSLRCFSKNFSYDFNICSPFCFSSILGVRATGSHLSHTLFLSPSDDMDLKQQRMALKMNTQHLAYTLRPLCVSDMQTPIPGSWNSCAAHPSRWQEKPRWLIACLCCSTGFMGCWRDRTGSRKISIGYEKSMSRCLWCLFKTSLQAPMFPLPLPALR